MTPFSIIVPVYNKENFVEECIKSVLRQTFSEYELILVDDGSADRSAIICDAYAAQDERIIVIHKANGGLSDARNEGLNSASGEYVLFLDGDDYWIDSSFLELIWGRLSKERTDVIIYGSRKIYSNCEILDAWIENYNEYEYGVSEDKIKYLMEHNIYQSSAWSKATKRAVIESRKIRFVKDQLSEDVEWSLKLLKCVRTVSVIPVASYAYRQDVNSISHTIGKKTSKILVM